MNTLPSPVTLVPNSSYETTRFNALRHGVLSRHTVLPWEDRSEYQTLLDALVEEHAPDGPTEEHLVEELAGIIWRKRRLRMAEAAVYREKLRHDATGHQGTRGPPCLARTAPRQEQPPTAFCAASSPPWIFRVHRPSQFAAVQTHASVEDGPKVDELLRRSEH